MTGAVPRVRPAVLTGCEPSARPGRLSELDVPAGAEPPPPLLLTTTPAGAVETPPCARVAGAVVGRLADRPGEEENGDSCGSERPELLELDDCDELDPPELELAEPPPPPPLDDEPPPPELELELLLDVRGIAWPPAIAGTVSARLAKTDATGRMRLTITNIMRCKSTASTRPSQMAQDRRRKRPGRGRMRTPVI